MRHSRFTKPNVRNNGDPTASAQIDNGDPTTSAQIDVEFTAVYPILVNLLGQGLVHFTVSALTITPSNEPTSARYIVVVAFRGTDS